MDFYVGFVVNSDNLGKMLELLEMSERIKDITHIKVIRTDQSNKQIIKQIATAVTDKKSVKEVLEEILHKPTNSEQIEKAVIKAGFSRFSWKGVLSAGVKKGTIKRTGTQRHALYQNAEKA